MKNTPTLAIAAILALTMLLVAACVPKETSPAQPSAQETPETPEAPTAPPVAAEVPEIAQAEQTVQEIGTSDLDEVESGLDELVLP